MHRDAALDPPGDEITADNARESALDVVDTVVAASVGDWTSLLSPPPTYWSTWSASPWLGCLCLGVRRRHASRPRQFG